MALVVPGATYRQLAGKSTVPLAPQTINLHTMAGTLAGTESWFSGSGRAYSHLGLGGGGGLRQWQDLRWRAASDLEGNWRCISIECEDTGPHFPAWSGSDVPRFTPAQVETLIVTLSWLCHRFGLPREAIGSSCTHERGIGWHRLGIDPWRHSSCPRWSSSRGKACPGDRRIHQLVHEIIPAIDAPEDIMSEATVIAALEKYFNASDGKKMVRTQARRGAAAALNSGTGRGQDDWAGTNKALLAAVQGNHNRLNALIATVQGLDPADVDEEAIAQAVIEGLDQDTAERIVARMGELLSARQGE